MFSKEQDLRERCPREEIAVSKFGTYSSRMRSKSLAGFGNKKRGLIWENAAWEEGQGGV